MAKGKYQRWLTPEGLLLIQGWARDGLTDEEIARKMGVTRKTLYEWMNKYGDICDAIKRNKEVADREVEQALFRKATGYKIKEVTRERRINPLTREPELVVIKEIEKDVAPDTAAQVFWLKNRKPNEWRDKREVETGAPASAFDNIAEITGRILEATSERSLDDFLEEEGEAHE